MITGASRGIGQAIAASVSPLLLKKDTTGLVYVLIARSSAGLQSTVDTINHQLSSQSPSINGSNIKIMPFVVDLEDLSTLEGSLSNVLTSVVPQHEIFDTTILFNNAGSVGPLGLAHTLTSLTGIQRAIDLNITSSIWLSSLFIRTFGPHTQRQCRVVNISSICAIQPFPTMSLYCAGKAARDMFHSVLAKDLASVSDSFPSSMKVLNYAPGPCKTEMTQELSRSTELEPTLSQYFNNAYNEGTLIDPWDSADRLVQLLIKDDFESGAHVDYFDLHSKSI